MARLGAPIYSVAITTTDGGGGAGTCTGSGTITVLREGYLEWVYYDFHASAPGTTDVTGTLATTPPGGLLFTSTSSATDVLQFPRGSAVTTGGVAITNSHVPLLVSGPITVAVAQCDALTAAVTVYVKVREI